MTPLCLHQDNSVGCSGKYFEQKKIILKFACVSRSFCIHWIALGMTISSRLGTVVQFFPVSHGTQRTLLYILGFHLCIA